MLLSTLLFALSTGGAPPASPAATGGIYHGRANQLAVQPPRIESASAHVTIDGRLDEPVWREAALLTGFSQYAPIDDRPAADSTDVLVWYSSASIHFGIRAFAEPGSVRATLADRDKIYGDDYIGIFLSTFNDGRNATVFAVNPLGVQGDGIHVESDAGAGGFGGRQVGRVGADISPDYVFQSKGRLTDYGYEVEIRIPFKSLRYQGADPQTWGLNAIRIVQSRGHENSWAPAKRAAASYLAQVGTLEGLTGLDRGLVLDVNPVLTHKTRGTPSAAGWGYDGERPEIGANVRWGLTSNLTFSGTANPDFAEVESDAGQVVFDPRQALFFAEKRPFFLEGREQFATPNNLIYTRRIVTPLAAAKLTGKIRGTNVAVLSAVDDEVASASRGDRPLYNIVRVQRDIGSQSRAGLVFTDKEDGDRYNRVAGADARLVFGRIWSVQLQGAWSQTAVPGAPTMSGPLWQAIVNRSGRTFGARYSFRGIDEEFRAQSGFISRLGVANASANHSLTLYGNRGGLVETFTTDVALDGTWKYRYLMHGRDAIEKKLHFNNNVRLRGGWRAGASVLVETFGYDPDLYADYFVERRLDGGALDTVPYVGTPRLPNLDWVLSFGTPQLKHFSGNAFVLWGRDENFFEWASADIVFADIGVAFRPTDKLRLDGSYILQSYVRRTDGSTVGRSRIPRLKLEYQVARPLFVRVVGEYFATEQDSLRDDSRTNDPVLIRSRATGALERTSAFTDNSFRADWLVAYQPSPGTVVFAGYGSTMTEPRAFGLDRLRRREDGFFVKLSYLFRI